MSKLRSSVVALSALVAMAALALLVGLAPTFAAPVAPAEVDASYLKVVASGLANPRGLAFDSAGSLYIAEAGSGGDGVCIPTAEGEKCYGTTGTITKVSFDGDGMPIGQAAVQSGLPSLGLKDSGDRGVGPHDIAFSEDESTMYLITGLGGDPALRDPGGSLETVGANFAQLMTATMAVDSWVPWLDLGAFEATVNPDGPKIDSNPFSLINNDGSLAVVDAGGNTLLSVDAGVISTTAVFESRMVEFPPGSGTQIPMDAVPTAVEVGPDDAYYVSELTGFPFPVGAANIYRVEPGQAPTVYADGFTNILDLAFDDEGELYVLEMFANGMTSGDPTSRITRINDDSSRTVIAEEGLVAATDLEIGPEGWLYVSNFGTSAVAGEVVRLDPRPTIARTLTVVATKDNTLYESEMGNISNGSGDFMFAGATGNGALRRAVVAFELDGAVPDGAEVMTATLSLNMSKTTAGEEAVSIHTLAQDWGEGASDADLEDGAGANAEPGDATWLNTFFDTDNWTAPGGDFDATASATTTVDGNGGYEWASPDVTADVQSWLADPSGNHGWIVVGDEANDGSAKRFDSRENDEAANRPMLTITYAVEGRESKVYLPVILR